MDVTDGQRIARSLYPPSIGCAATTPPVSARGCLILCGTDLTQAMLGAAVRCPELETELTAVYEAAICYEEDH
jgi:hypothetical protein